MRERGLVFSKPPHLPVVPCGEEDVLRVIPSLLGNIRNILKRQLCIMGLRQRNKIIHNTMRDRLKMPCKAVVPSANPALLFLIPFQSTFF